MVDDMPSQDRAKEWKEMYDPDIAHLIGHASPLPNQIWRPNDLKNQDLMVKLGFIQTDDIQIEDY